jgi:hypothetical protein
MRRGATLRVAYIALLSNLTKMSNESRTARFKAKQGSNQFGGRLKRRGDGDATNCTDDSGLV